MLLDTAAEIFESEEYIFEPKSNGIRLELISAADGIKLYTRHGNDITTSLPEIIRLDIPTGMALDGELVCYSNQITEDFESVMTRIMAKSERKVNELLKEYPCTYVVFDILQHKNEMITKLPLSDRIELLDQTINNQDHLRKVVRTSDGIALFELIKQHKLEGVVAKKLSSSYHVGKRPKDLWLKVINWRYNECFIVGYRKDKFGWIISDGINYLGTIEFGAISKHKQKFYNMVERKKENKSIIYIKPIKCIVKHRGYLNSGKMMTPVFNSFCE